MALSVTNLTDYVTQALGGALSSQVTINNVINQAGEHFCAFHRWKFLEERSTTLDLRADIALTGATWTEASKTITKTGAFTNYSDVAGDKVEITGGTGATTGFYEIASRTDNDNIVLIASIGSGADGQTDIAGTMELQTVGLPSDFQELIAYDATQSLVNSLELVSYQFLVALRTNQIEVASFNFYGAISHAQAEAGSGAPTPILEIWPSPSANDDDGLTIFYRAGWKVVSGGSDTVNIPVYCEMAFTDLVRQIAKGYEEEDAMTQAERLTAWEMSPAVRAAISRDGMIQPDYGPIRGGAVQSMPHSVNRYLRTTVSGPS